MPSVNNTLEPNAKSSTTYNDKRTVALYEAQNRENNQSTEPSKSNSNCNAENTTKSNVNIPHQHEASPEKQIQRSSWSGTSEKSNEKSTFLQANEKIIVFHSNENNLDAGFQPLASVEEMSDDMQLYLDIEPVAAEAVPTQWYQVSSQTVRIDL